MLMNEIKQKQVNYYICENILCVCVYEEKSLIDTVFKKHINV